MIKVYYRYEEIGVEKADRHMYSFLEAIADRLKAYIAELPIHGEIESQPGQFIIGIRVNPTLEVYIEAIGFSVELTEKIVPFLSRFQEMRIP